MTLQDIHEHLYDRPFRSFRIHLSDGSSVPVVNPALLILSETSAVLPVETGKDPEGHPLVKRWRTIAIAHIVQFSDVDEMVSGKGKKRG